MSKPDLDTVAARRLQIARELAGLEKLRAEMEVEDQELIVAERALKRLVALSGATAQSPAQSAGEERRAND